MSAPFFARPGAAVGDAGRRPRDGAESAAAGRGMTRGGAAG